ncbi:MAG: hypothetical protein AAF907_00920 [Planctomycetota bacterium]
MTYGITFTRDAQTQIAILLDGPRDAERINDAVLQIYAELRSEPELVGESRESGIRIRLIDPLTFFFRVDRDRVRVTVLRVHRHEPPPPKASPSSW